MNQSAISLPSATLGTTFLYTVLAGVQARIVARVARGAVPLLLSRLDLSPRPEGPLGGCPPAPPPSHGGPPPYFGGFLSPPGPPPPPPVFWRAVRTKYTPPPASLGFSKRKPPPCLRPVFHVRTGAVSGLDTVQPRQTEQFSGIRYVGGSRKGLRMRGLHDDLPCPGHGCARDVATKRMAVIHHDGRICRWASDSGHPRACPRVQLLVAPKTLHPLARYTEPDKMESADLSGRRRRRDTDASL